MHSFEDIFNFSRYFTFLCLVKEDLLGPKSNPTHNQLSNCAYRCNPSQTLHFSAGFALIGSLFGTRGIYVQEKIPGVTFSLLGDGGGS